MNEHTRTYAAAVDADSTTHPPSTYSKTRSDWARVARRVLLGQAAALVIALTGVFTTLLVDDNASMPFFQNLCAYTGLTAVFFPLHVALQGRQGRAADGVASRLRPVHFAWWRYAVVAALDFGGNTLAVWAYNYTDIMSVQLLDCFTIPVVMLASRLLFRRRHRCTQLLGSVVAVTGMVVLVVLDSLGKTQSREAPNPPMGDAFCVAASVCYALSNVSCEALIKAPEPQTMSSLGPPDTAQEEQGYSSVDGVVEHVPCSTVAAVEAEEAKGAPSRYLTRNTLDATPFALVVEYLAFMGPFGILYAGIAVACSWSATAAALQNATVYDGLYLFFFTAVMVGIYALMPALFLASSATFANLSLLAADAYALLMNLVVFGVQPQPLFFVPLGVIVCGVVLYQGPVDLERLRYRYCTFWSPSPERRLGASNLTNDA